MTISLHPLDRRDAGRFAHIAVRPGQERFAGTVDAALVEPEATVDLHEIREAGGVVGLFKIDRAYHLRHDFAQADHLGLRGVILDQKRQGRGLGTAAMTALKGYLPPAYPGKARVWLTVNMANPPAIAAYRKAGFVETGDIWPHGSAGPQLIMFMPLG
ncbi:GNAT family N-acetyltransferase [Paracoccus saliphilus]|uniref:Acetyltransferase (GNAT) family protein n=1 Tax=Paracoccus saliphilus TaxID=405559 RepID=A0AA45W409_9RHOB|nr:GNAT family protein [Paracoccus saliphilus]WCR04206.1 GNAT family N-acetyltransferase [Paracoccus saliphilus]SIS81099.1 Acetyltransferase (GNAT) family protein [Paracoccus saliphilus]